MNATETKVTSVANVHGKDPNAWCADPFHVYVGRAVFLRGGRHAGKQWANSGLGNPVRFDEDDGLQQKRVKLVQFARHLKETLARHAWLFARFKELQGKTLGCWCVDWSGHGDLPLCHAAWLARIVDLYFEPRSSGVIVTADDVRRLRPGDVSQDGASVVFRR